jgi:hypothetical protein
MSKTGNKSKHPAPPGSTDIQLHNANLKLENPNENRTSRCLGKLFLPIFIGFLVAVGIVAAFFLLNGTKEITSSTSSAAEKYVSFPPMKLNEFLRKLPIKNFAIYNPCAKFDDGGKCNTKAQRKYYEDRGYTVLEEESPSENPQF